MLLNNTPSEDGNTRIYLDEIGRIPLIDQKREQEYALPIRRREYIKRMRNMHDGSADVFGTHRILQRISENTPTIAGLFMSAGQDGDPQMSDLAGNRKFHALVDNPPSEKTIATVRRWSGDRSDRRATERVKTIALDTLCITGVAIHVTDDCRISDLPVHMEDPRFRARLFQMGHHLTEELDALCAVGDENQKKLADANLRLVVSIAKNYMGLNIPLNDLIQEGNIGLLTGTERFDHWRGNKFSTFATWWIRHSIHQCLTRQRRTVRLPEHKIKLIAQINNARREIGQDYQRTASDEEVADYLEIPVELVKNADIIRQPIANLDDPIADETDTTLADTIAAEGESVEEAVCATDRSDVIHEALGHLSETENRVICLRYGLINDSPMTISNTAEVMKVTNHQVREAERSALEKLQNSPDLRAMLAEYAIS